MQVNVLKMWERGVVTVYQATCMQCNALVGCSLTAGEIDELANGDKAVAPLRYFDSYLCPGCNPPEVLNDRTY